MELVIAFIGTVTAVITVACTNYYAKRNQIKLEERKLKEEYYLEFLSALSSSAIHTNSDEVLEKISDAQNRLLLTASPLVVEKLMNFHDYVNPANRHLHPHLEAHDSLLQELLIAMRADLFGNDRVNKNYPQIHLTGRSNKGQ